METVYAITAQDADFVEYLVRTVTGTRAQAIAVANGVRRRLNVNVCVTELDTTSTPR